MINPDHIYPYNPDKRWLLLPSNYQQSGKNDFDHVGDQTREMFGGRQNILIVTSAKNAVEGQEKAMTRLEVALSRYGAKNFLHSHLMTPEDLHRAGENDIEGIMVGGGNTFRLVKDLHDPRLSLGHWIAWMVAEGRPYSGTSAGQQALAEDIRTCADERNIVSYINGIPSILIGGLNIIRGNINMHPHYLELGAGGPSIGGGSEAELRNYAVEDPTRKILGVRNGAALYVQGQDMSVVGEGDGVDLITDKTTVTFVPGQRFSQLTV